MLHRWQTSPYVTMWTRPRETLKKILSTNPREGFMILAFFHGLVHALNIAQGLSFGQDLSVGMNLLLAILVAFPIGALYFYIATFFFYYVGKVLKAKGSFLAIRSAIAWANVPQILGSFITLLMVAYFKNAFFFREFLMQPFEGGALILVMLFLITQIVLSVWTFIIFVGALSQVQHISISLTLVNVVLVVVLYLAIVFILGKILMLMGSNPIAYLGGIL